MRIHAPALLLSCIMMTAAANAAAGSMSVSFADPAGFSDAGDTPRERTANLKALADHLQSLARRYLPADQLLKVEVLDVELAGTVHPTPHAGHDLRIVNGGADWPRIHLRYTLEASGQQPQSGEERLADANYTWGFAGITSSDPLRYEKRLLDDWFKSRFVEHRQSGS